MPLQMRGAPQKRMQLIASASDWFVPFGGTPKVPLDLMDISRFNGVTIQQPALDAAIHALALVQLGTSSRNPDLLAHAQKEYGRSLRLLSSYIARSSKVWDEETASAIVVLKYCEASLKLRRWIAFGASANYIIQRSLSILCTLHKLPAYTTLVYSTFYCTEVPFHSKTLRSPYCSAKLE